MAIERQTAELFARLYAMNDGKPFEPTAYFDPEMDQLIYLRSNESYRANRVDEHLTLLWHAQHPQLVGVKIKGFRSLFDRLKEQGLVEESHFIPLCKALTLLLHNGIEETRAQQGTTPPKTNAHHSTHDNIYRAKLYRQAEEVVGDYRYRLDERLLKIAPCHAY
ncbi:hypothetical protein [Azospirillum sp. sgz301742]